MNSSRTKKVTIPADILAELNDLPTSRGGQLAATYTPEQDAILLERWNITQKASFVLWWRKKYGATSENTLRKRLVHLRGQANGK